MARHQNTYRIEFSDRMRARIMRVTSSAWKLIVKDFKKHRADTVRLLRRQGYEDIVICQVLEVSQQYLWRKYGKKGRKRKDGTPVKGGNRWLSSGSSLLGDE